MFSLAVPFVAVALSGAASDPWLTFPPGNGPARGKTVVLVSGDEEYRSEEALPQLARILSRQGFACTVLFAIDPADGTICPNVTNNIPGLEKLRNADLMILFTRFRDLPAEQMRYVVEYVQSGRPIIGMRTATHAFRIAGGPYARYSWDSAEPGYEGGFGRQVLGETWINHHGTHGKEGTRGIPAPGQEAHPILRGVTAGSIFGPTDVYAVRLPLPGDSTPVVLGEVTETLDPASPPVAAKNSPMMPVAWVRTYAAESGKRARVFATTMGSAQDLLYEGTRRMLVNAALWAVGLERRITPKLDVSLVGDYQPSPFRFRNTEQWKPGTSPAALLQSATQPSWTYDAALLQPFWRGTIMRDESVLFTANGEQAASASLLFEPTAILSVRSASGAVSYEPGRDYIRHKGSRTIVLPPGSRIVSCKPQDLRRPSGSQQFSLTHRDGGDEILFGGGHEYHDMQTVITYRHAARAWKGPTPEYAGAALPRTMTRLRARQPLRIALFGDSISTGCNASGWAGAAPFQPPWQDLLVMYLRGRYGGPVTLSNHAVGGVDTAWGVANIDPVAKAGADLVLLAFGMNDAAGRGPEEFKNNVATMMASVRQVRPDTEFILVAPMLANRDWTALRHELFAGYREALRQLTGPGVAVADLTSVWEEMLKHKLDRDLTGNGVNHPNDFGHRVYAQVLAAMLTP